MNAVEKYLRSVAGQIRVKRIREPLIGELRAHMQDQAEALARDGLSSEEAEARAIGDMGDAQLVGEALDAAHRPRLCWRGLLLAAALSVLGLLLQRMLGAHDSTGFALRLCVLGAETGVLLLPACTDYTRWTLLAIPGTLLWLVLGVFRMLRLFGSPAVSGLFSPLFSLVSPQLLATAAPALLICLLRGRGRPAFAVLLLFALFAAALPLSYTQTGFDPNAMLLSALLCPALLALSVHRGFFRVRRTPACLLILLLFSVPLILFLRRFIMKLSTPQESTQALLAALRHARPIGAAHLAPADAELNLASPDAMIHGILRLGWLPFALFTLALLLLLAYLLRRFARMENRMGALIGLSASATLALQCLLYYLCTFSNYTDSLCLPLVSRGSAMLLLDAMLCGLILSCLRGEALPEPESRPRRARRVK